MKSRATVVCVRDSAILLVSKPQSRWALPGGRIRTNERPADAARREVAEETGVIVDRVVYLFQFRGLSTVHHVFWASLPEGAAPRPGEEITRCGWFARADLITLPTSVPTREIVRLVLEPHSALAGMCAA
ncbi:NUDIX hydrolase [Paraburkholderia sp. SOS3]|jgi:8-oxo-dGTP diphosphatase|uniref:NUDIX hydrolase n=1 Tax=Paraburkholderia sp. SOS3 TaxID=1926494 RepID=UPI0009FAA0D7|nr:NUDIX domain-containing protein [Paraburkholderia sp. SOS3]